MRSIIPVSIIYRPKSARFDGIILDLNNIDIQKVRGRCDTARKRVRRTVISIAKEIEDFYYVGINNEKAMWVMIEHLYEKHGCKNTGL